VVIYHDVRRSTWDIARGCVVMSSPRPSSGHCEAGI